MKTLQDIREDFMKQALEYDLGRSEEDFHSYLRHHNLEHHLSETQIRERNMENNKLNGLGMVMGIGVPLTLGAIYGLQKLSSNIIGHGEFQIEPPRDIDNLIRGSNIPTDRPESLSGFNTRSMPTAPAGVGQSTESNVGFFDRNLGSENNPITLNEMGGLFSKTMKDIFIGSSRLSEIPLKKREGRIISSIPLKRKQEVSRIPIKIREVGNIVEEERRQIAKDKFLKRSQSMGQRSQSQDIGISPPTSLL